MRSIYIYLSIFGICCYLYGCSSKPKQKPIAQNITSEFIFNKKPSNNCHAATLVELNSNRLMAAWFGGDYEGATNVGIYTSIYADTQWSSPSMIVKPWITESDTLPCWNPVLFKSKSETLYLFYKIGKNPREWFGAYIFSDNDGKQWSEPQLLPEGILGPIKNKPIEIEKGIIICGSSTESVDNKWRVHTEIFNENSKDWERININNDKNLDAIQPTFIIHKNKTLQMLCRSKHNKIVSSWSYNNGTSWNTLDTISVINSNSGIDALTLNDSLFLMVNNPMKQGPDWYYGRNILDVEYSNDGLSWKKLVDLEHQDKGEFSYPAIIQTSNEKVHILYTYNREYIKHISFDLIQ